VNYAKRSNPKDIAFWEGWLIDNPGKKQLAEEAALMVDGLLFNKKSLPSAQIESALGRLNKTIDQQLEAKQRKASRRMTRKSFLRLAAAFAILLIGFLSYQSLNAPKEIAYRTDYGEQINLKLADGTLVVLNANSALSYYSNDSRQVWLAGEAFFEVEKKPSTNAKFLVHTNDLVVEVLGTAFNVNNQLDQTEVVLEEGKIKLELRNGEKTLMAPGDLLSYSGSKNKVIQQKSQVKPEFHTAWKNGILRFNNQPLEVALKKIEATFGVTTVFKDQTTAKRNITGPIPTKTLDIAIGAIEKAMTLSITNKNGVLIIENPE